MKNNLRSVPARYTQNSLFFKIHAGIVLHCIVSLFNFGKLYRPYIMNVYLSDINSNQHIQKKKRKKKYMPDFKMVTD